MNGTIRLGLWGGPGSGKTTYLAALRSAALFDETGDWRVDGQDDLFPGSSKFLSDQTTALRSGLFPSPTVGVSDYGYKVSGTLASPLFYRIADLLRLKSESRRNILERFGMGRLINFVLQVRDYPGRSFTSTDFRDELWGYLAQCQGLVFLFDPELERGDRANFEYIQQAVDFLSQAMQSSGQLVQDRLPQYLAVCVTKFDEPTIFQQLREAGLVDVVVDGSRSFPHVRRARDAFRLLAEQFTVRTVERYFHRRRVQYFVTSSIGFYADEKTGQLDLEDCAKVIDTSEGKRMRGLPAPINVFPPMLWLYRQLARQAQRTQAPPSLPENLE